MSYVQIRYSGYVLGADKELQSLTPSGVGSGTVFDHIMSYNSSDDGAEFFGGVVNMKYYVSVGADDDSLDADVGIQGNFQYGLLIQRAGAGDALLELDSNGFETDTPRTKLQFSNFVMLQSAVSSSNEANDQAAILIRGNSDVTIANSVINTPVNECLRLNGSGAVPATVLARSTVLNCNAAKFLGTGSYNAAATTTQFGAGANNNRDTFTPTFTSLFVNGSNESGVVAFDPTTLSSFFSATTFIGAVQSLADTWYAGWTCNSGAANFGSTSGSCTSLPTT
jgi:hypothetical protein